MTSKPIYKIIFLNQGKVYELYARHVSQGGALFGFVEVEELVFDARKSVVVDPAEERVQIEFAGVKKTYLPDALRAANRRSREAGRQQSHSGRRQQRDAVSAPGISTPRSGRRQG